MIGAGIQLYNINYIYHITRCLTLKCPKVNLLQWIDSFHFDNQCIDLLFVEKTIVICLKKVKKYHNRLIIFLLIINVLIYYSLKKTIVICLKKCQKVSPILCLSLSEFIFQHKLSSCQVEMKIPEVILYTVKKISKS